MNQVSLVLLQPTNKIEYDTHISHRMTFESGTYDQVSNQVDCTALTQKDKHISVKIGILPYMPFSFINEKEHQKSTTFSFALHLFILTVVREDDSINSYSFTRTFIQSFS